jgi:murein L,D-transpeptidase YafK
MAEQEQNWLFTWGVGQAYPGKYVRIHGTHQGARREMVYRHGLKWAFQYPAEEEVELKAHCMTEMIPVFWCEQCKCADVRPHKQEQDHVA